MREEKTPNSSFDVEAVVQKNWSRLEQRFASAAAGGARWLVECRDLSNAYDDDGGVYFVECSNAAAVDAVVNRCPDNSPWDRVLAIYDLSRPLAEQGRGLTRAEWLELWPQICL